MNSPNPARRVRALGIALLMVIFVAGGFAGFSFNRVLQAGEPADGTDSCASRAEKHDSSILDRLELTPGQRAQIDDILERRRGEIADFWEGEGARFRVIVDSTRAEIRHVLTPTQRAEYDRLRAERRARHRAQKEAARADER